MCGISSADSMGNNIEFLAENFPPGTKIEVSIPICPECDTPAELNELDCDCGFDWESWTLDIYS